jgi:hypothetical protein
LVVPNETQLKQSAEIFLQGENLPEPPLICKSLSGRYVGSGLRPVGLPVGEQICTGSFVFGDVKRGACGYIVAPVPGSHVIARPRNVSTGGGHKSIAGIEVGAAEVPS